MLWKEKPLERCMGAERTMPVVVSVAWVEGGRREGFGRIVEGEMVRWREAALRRAGRAKRSRRKRIVRMRLKVRCWCGGSDALSKDLTLVVGLS